ncbi:hypothetical protein KZ292_28460, partial [Escherichia coli]|nr:hypothetical protein [Escherichia coli]
VPENCWQVSTGNRRDSRSSQCREADSGEMRGDAPATRRRRACEATRASKSGHHHASATRQRGDSEATPMRQQTVAE